MCATWTGSFADRYAVKRLQRMPLAAAMSPLLTTIPDMIGRTIAHYHITAAIGSGGMGDVFRCCLGLFLCRSGRLWPS